MEKRLNSLTGMSKIGTEAQIGGNEVGILRTEVDFRTDIAHIQTKCEVTFAGADVHIVVPIHGYIGGKGRSRGDLIGIVAGEI